VFAAEARFPAPEDDLATLNLEDSWLVDRCGIYERQATGPDGRREILRDSVVLVRRLDN
jgi:hypothetical protein